MRKHTLLDIKNVQDYYAAITWLHHDFEEGLTGNFATFERAIHRVLRRTNHA
jgi:hypothetical protein